MAPNLPEFYTTESPPRRFNKRSRVPNSTGHPAILQPSQILYQTFSGNLWWYTPSRCHLLKIEIQVQSAQAWLWRAAAPGSPLLCNITVQLLSIGATTGDSVPKANSQVTTFSNILQKSFDSTTVNIRQRLLRIRESSISASRDLLRDSILLKAFLWNPQLRSSGPAQWPHCRQRGYRWLTSLLADLESLGLLVPTSYANASWSTTFVATGLSSCFRPPQKTERF